MYMQQYQTYRHSNNIIITNVIMHFNKAIPFYPKRNSAMRKRQSLFIDMALQKIYNIKGYMYLLPAGKHEMQNPYPIPQKPRYTVLRFY